LTYTALVTKSKGAFLEKCTEEKQPTTVDVKWVQTHYMIKPGLQSKLRIMGVLPYYILPNTTKILYKRKDVEEMVESGKIDISSYSNPIGAGGDKR
jgi:hypothetical protein